MTVEVRDLHTHEPVSQVVVVVEALNMFMPTGDYGLINRHPGQTQRGVTDIAGSVRLHNASCPGYIILVSADRMPQSISFDEHPAVTKKPTDWITTAPFQHLPAIVPNLQVRLLP
ncbi:MAG: hypothetical protein HRT46_12045 [Deltaproteobacteria bacterium]|nr:hypothetical protein [Deltaproteobacteria bacterium]